MLWVYDGDNEDVSKRDRQLEARRLEAVEATSSTNSELNRVASLSGKARTSRYNDRTLLK